MRFLHFPTARSVSGALARPFKHTPFFSPALFLPPSVPMLFSFHCLCALRAPSLVRSLFSSCCPSSSIFLPSRSLTVWISLVHTHGSVFFPVSPSPSPFSWVISLSYVCPSLCVCVPPLFVSDSFSREIRDAYLVPLFSTSATALSYAALRWPEKCEKRHLHSPCTLRDLIGVRGPDAE